MTPSSWSNYAEIERCLSTVLWWRIIDNGSQFREFARDKRQPLIDRKFTQFYRLHLDRLLITFISTFHFQCLNPLITIGRGSIRPIVFSSLNMLIEVQMQLKPTIVRFSICCGTMASRCDDTCHFVSYPMHSGNTLEYLRWNYVHRKHCDITDW